VQVLVVTGLGKRLGRTGVADERDHLTLRDLRPYLDILRDVGQVRVSRDDAVPVVDPHLAAAELVQRAGSV
jgi:hypothetical protein